MSNLSPISQAFVDQQGAVAFSASAPWLDQLRKAGLESFSADGLPTPKLEDWKYTNLNVLEKIDAGQRGDAAIDSTQLTWLPTELATHKLVFVNGRFQSELSAIGDLPKGVKVLALSEALASEPGLVEEHLGQIGGFEKAPVLALNTAFIEDGYVVMVDKAELATPIEIVFVSQAKNEAAHHPRNLIVAKNNARVTILERHIGIGEGGYLANSAFEVLVEDGAHVQHYRLLEDSADGINLSSVKAKLGKDATYDSFVLSMSGQLSRNEIHVSCEAGGAHTNLNGVYVGRGDQHIDNTTLIDHVVPNTSSKETYKGALDGKSRGVFQGAIIVADGADGTDGRMSNKTLLLSDDAEIDAKPQLEIYADDVQCAHGFTAGELDENSLFYLRSRGIPEAIARSMLVEGFLDEVVEEGVAEDYQDIFKTRIADWMNSG
ncbi:MAG: Fe-S cluster assembly protein SufD [Rhodospirillaceae bacterium]|jgi:Fe-S cluster assembly protein SufD|nr:Fe-S cluster assembly protein SufD [Rhodospirillaceae bacterium]MBT4588785.1 Fe-S cluster assembly protein SufD [Rhodospirillaceae bacterium]MBT5939207.1 Fe-S cluster assembly protein SufD [Rhodospirillaceae bacterium]MBT7268104.1 Fe-S cluster assembly protein SufD [Rhodospirillaceae bacterium]